jgi:hypothetical protein
VFGIGLVFNGWRLVDFGNLTTSHELRIIVPSMVAIVGGFQVAFTAMFITLLKIHFTQD